MNKYTVVCLYNDNKQVYVTSVKANSVGHAVTLAHSEQDVAVLSVFEGEHMDVYGEDELIED